MAKFAHECMKKMSELVLKLKETLGEDTAELCMRFGLHSGPVTAGVLRGEKSRFQLFGNTGTYDKLVQMRWNKSNLICMSPHDFL